MSALLVEPKCQPGDHSRAKWFADTLAARLDSMAGELPSAKRAYLRRRLRIWRRRAQGLSRYYERFGNARKAPSAPANGILGDDPALTPGNLAAATERAREYEIYFLSPEFKALPKRRRAYLRSRWRLWLKRAGGDSLHFNKYGNRRISANSRNIEV